MIHSTDLGFFNRGGDLRSSREEDEDQRDDRCQQHNGEDQQSDGMTQYYKMHVTHRRTTKRLGNFLHLYKFILIITAKTHMKKVAAVYK